jgi:hypothetical protein
MEICTYIMPPEAIPTVYSISHFIHNNVGSVLRNGRKLHTVIQNTRRGMPTSDVVSSMTMRARIHLLVLQQHCWSISTGSCLTTILSALISFRATTTCLPIWRTGCDHSSSAKMMTFRKVTKRGWVDTRQASLTQAYKNVFPNPTRSLRWEVA